MLAWTDLAAEVLGAGLDDRFYSSSKLLSAYAHANSMCAGLRSGATAILDREWATPERVVEISRIWIHNTCAAIGYWQRPDATAECFEAGSFSPGDPVSSTPATAVSRSAAGRTIC